MKYGFIKGYGQGYVAFSGHFQTYLELVSREWDLWPLWSATERALRRFITGVMVNKYGENWIEELEKEKSHLKAIFDRCREAQTKEKRTFGERASRNLIDFTYPQELFNIIFAEWNTFKDYLGQDKNYWNQRSQLLAKIRNPLAHNRNESLHDYERQIAEGYCKEILDRLKESVQLA